MELTKTTLHSRAAAASSFLAERLVDADRIGDRVGEIVRPYADRSLWSPVYLDHGHPGVALLFAELAHRDPSWRAAGVAHLAEAVKLPVPAVGSLYHGAAALGLVLELARGSLGDASKVRKQLREVVERQAIARTATIAEQARVPGGGTTFSSYDAVSGLSGLLVHLLSSEDSDPATVEAAVNSLAGITRHGVVRGHPVPGWWVNHGPMSLDPTDDLDNPPHINVGVAHGGAGVLAALLTAIESGRRSADLERAAESLAEWLVDNVRTDAGLLHWPPWLSLPDRPARRRDVKYAGLASWCYGTPGISAVLLRASLVLDRPELSTTATRLVAAMLGLLDGWMPESPTLCHGLAGLLTFLNMLDLPELGTDISAARDRAARLLCELIDDAEPFGLLTVNDGAARLSLPGFLTGTAGVALALHAYATGQPSRTGWERALMLR